MSFHTFVKNTTISAADFDDNYKWIRQTDVLPRGGSSLDPTTNVYNLGDVSYRWKTCYADQLTVMGEINPTSSMTLVSEFTLTSTASSIEITGLGGQTDCCYYIITNTKHIYTNSSNRIVKMYINSDSSTVYYHQKLYMFDAGSYAITAAYEACSYIEHSFIHMLRTTTTFNNCAEIYLTSKSGIKNMLIKAIGESQDLYFTYLTYYAIAININSAISQILFLDTLNTFCTGTNIQIYAMR